MKVPFVDLNQQYLDHKERLDEVYQDVFQKSIFIGGSTVSDFEQSFQEYIGTRKAVSVNSGTDALILGTRALGLKQGDEIIFPANTYYATLLSAVANGLSVVLSDASEDDFGYDLEKLKKAISKKTKAIMLVHLYGQPEKIAEIQKIIRSTGRTIYLLEDSCQAHGARYKGKRVGSFGSFSAFSFYPSKNLGAYGDGGAITTNDLELARQMQLLKEYGQTEKYHHISIGFNSRLDTLQAAFLQYKLQHIDAWNTRRQELAARYSHYLQIIPEVKLPKAFSERPSVYHLYVIRTKQRDALQNYLAEKDITTQIHYPYPIHLQKAWSSLGYTKGDFPVAERLANEILSLPMYPELTDEQVRYVCAAIINFFFNFS